MTLLAVFVGGVGIGVAVGLLLARRPLLRRLRLDPLDESYRTLSAQIKGRIP